MNSHALIKVDTRQSWLERVLGARGSRLLLAGGGTAAVMLSIPSPLIERIATSTGLNEITQLLEPPIGIGTRILLAAGCALVAAALVGALWRPGDINEDGASDGFEDPDEEYDYGAGPTSGRSARDRQDSDCGNDDIGEVSEMIQAQKQSSGLGWSALIRLVRGGFHDAAETTGEHKQVSHRRRRDRHPDAPPRPPLSASRDLPPYDAHNAASFTAPVEEQPGTLADARLSAAIAFARAQPAGVDAEPHDSPGSMRDEDIARVIAAMPRSSEPMSDEDVSRVVATIPTSDAAAPATTSPSQANKSSVASLLREIDLPLIENADLAALAARFEHGLGKREVIVNAAEAQHSLDARIAFVQPDPSVRAALRAQRPLAIVSAPTAETDIDSEEPASGPTLALDGDVESALNNALSTLRKLTEQGRR